jgi:ABC-type antimicrobial peptide transport system permease subunit
MAGIDFDYVETMGIKMKSGRPFSKAYSVDIPHDTSGTFLINEQLEKLMGTPDAVGKQLKFGSTRGQIVGVMKDFNFQSLHSRIDPLALWIWPSKYLGFIFVRIKPGNLRESLKEIEKDWRRIVPSYPFDFHFIDQEIANLYKVEEQTGTLLKYFSILAIMIACIGLFGLATYTVEQRTRELGLRKALGASGGSILILISGEFLRLLIVAAAIALPLSLILLHRYLASYGYHIPLDFRIFVLGVFIAFVIAGLAISYQLITATNNNPAESLKYE